MELEKMELKELIAKGRKVCTDQDDLEMTVSDLSYFFDLYIKVKDKHGEYDAIWDVVVAAYHAGVAAGRES